MIGEGGTSLNEISVKSGARIDTKTEESEPGKKAFKLTGSTEAVEKAAQLIDDIVQKNITPTQTWIPKVVTNEGASSSSDHHTRPVTATAPCGLSRRKSKTYPPWADTNDDDQDNYE